jgi:hypothetical protein
MALTTSQGNSNQDEPTVRDFRQYIANELHMADSAELLELLIANKILDADLKLRVVHQTIWKGHCVLLSNSSSGSNRSVWLICMPLVKEVYLAVV